MVDRLEEIRRIKEVNALRNGPVLQSDYETSQVLGFEKGLKEPLIKMQERIEGIDYDIPQHLSGRFPAGAMGVIPTADERRRKLVGRVEKKRQEGVVPGLAGEIGGNIIAGIPSAVVRGPSAIKGGIEGAILSQSDDPRGIATDVGFGVLGSVVGDAAVRGVRGALSPKVNSASKELYEAGITHLTPGQALGGFSKRIEDALMSVPWIGDVIANARTRGLEDFNSVILNNVLEPIGEKIPEGVKGFGRDAVTYVGDKLSKKYEDLLPKLSARVDDVVQDELSSIVAKYSTVMSDDNVRTLGRIYKNRIPPKFYSEEGITGNQFKFLMRDLKDLAASKKGGGEAEVAEALNEMIASLNNSLKRANPQYVEQLRALDTGWARLADVETAAARAGAETGMFTPAQYTSAIRQGDKSVRKRSFARGTSSPMQGFAEMSKETLPSTLPDSGTATRAGLMSGMGALGGAYIDPVVAATILGSSSLYTKPGQRAINVGLFARPAWARTTADKLDVLQEPFRRATTAIGSQLGN